MAEETELTPPSEPGPVRGRKPKARAATEVIADAAALIRAALAGNDTRDAGKALARLEQVQEHAALALKG